MSDADQSLSHDQREALLALMLTPGLGHGLIARCLEAFGSAAAVCEASPLELAGIRGLSRDRAFEIHQAIRRIRTDGSLQREQDAMASAGVRTVCQGDAEYPRLLAAIPDPPVMLYVRGRLDSSDALAVAVVGARQCSHYGREQADRFAFQLAEAGLTVVSGGAYGIDVTAHRAALRAGGRTLAVIGSGLARPYPREHASLFDQIVAEDRGAILSEYPMTTGPLAENFPRRNRIISGLSLGVLVIEAGLRSGAMITARLAVEEHNRECMVLPGRVDSPQSEGCHRLLREAAAALVTRPAEVLTVLEGAGALLHAVEHPGETVVCTPAAASLSPLQARLMAMLDVPRSLDQLVSLSGLAVPQVQAELTRLEIRGNLTRQGGLFVRRGGA